MDAKEKVFRAHRAMAFLYAVIGLGVLAAVWFGSSGRIDLSILPVLLVLACIFSAHFFTARACRQGKPGGRIASIVIACVMLIGFPVGTLIGIYLLANTWKPWNPIEDSVTP